MYMHGGKWPDPMLPGYSLISVALGVLQMPKQESEEELSVSLSLHHISSLFLF